MQIDKVTHGSTERFRKGRAHDAKWVYLWTGDDDILVLLASTIAHQSSHLIMQIDKVTHGSTERILGIAMGG